MTVVYLPRSDYLNAISTSLGRKKPRPILFLAWDLDILTYKYDLLRLDTSAVYYESPRTEYLMRMSQRASDTCKPNATKCERLLHDVRMRGAWHREGLFAGFR